MVLFEVMDFHLLDKESVVTIVDSKYTKEVEGVSLTKQGVCFCLPVEALMILDCMLSMLSLHSWVKHVASVHL